MKIKKLYLLFISFTLLIMFLSGCNDAKEVKKEPSRSIQQIAYNSLSPREKDDGIL